MQMRPPRGFTLIELMIAVAVVAILVRLAFPSYVDYVRRARVPAGLEALSAYALRMEQYYQDQGTYGTTSCGVALPTGINNFTITCALLSGKAYTATVTGSSMLNGYTYTVDESGLRRTTAHPKGVPSGNCWSIRGSTCDS